MQNAALGVEHAPSAGLSWGRTEGTQPMLLPEHLGHGLGMALVTAGILSNHHAAVAQQNAPAARLPTMTAEANQRLDDANLAHEAVSRQAPAPSS